MEQGTRRSAPPSTTILVCVTYSETHAWFSSISQTFAGSSRTVHVRLSEITKTQANVKSLGDCATYNARVSQNLVVAPACWWARQRKNPQNSEFRRIEKKVILFLFLFQESLWVTKPVWISFQLNVSCIGQLFKLERVQYCMCKREQTHIHFLVLVYNF